MKISLIMILYKEQYGKIGYLKNLDENFLGWICPLLKQEFVLVEQYLYYARSLMDAMLFLRGEHLSHIYVFVLYI